MGEISSEGLNLNKLDIASRDKAKEAIGSIDNALDKLSAQQAKVGALINRLEHSTKVAAVMHENVTNSESRIRDADEAKAMMDFTKLQIMFNVQSSVLSQANQQSQNVLSIIRQ
ncbi:MAG: flagellin [Synergistaceae bacterium]|nr:flagellin [Synergistaceae bacterium]